MKTTRLFVLAVLSVAALSLEACGENGADTERAGSSAGGDFSVTTLEGERFDLSGGTGEVVALYFMAGW